MRVLVACEFSGVVRRAFRARGHDAWSCDLLPAEDDSRHHFLCDVRDISSGGWDLMIAHPPCTRLTNSGVRWLHERDLWNELDQSCLFFSQLLNAPIERIAIENPIPHKYALDRIGKKYDPIIQPHWFGHGETKATCLWLKNLPKLEPTDPVSGRTARVHLASSGPDRWKERSRTLPGIAEAFAAKWG